MTQPGGDTPRGHLGRRGEDIAAEYLAAHGYSVVDRNWRCARGEIDLVAQSGTDLVFVEVKTRSSLAFGHPVESVTLTKLARLRQLAGLWCREHPGTPGDVRIDVIAVVAPVSKPFTLEHITGVFA